MTVSVGGFGAEQIPSAIDNCSCDREIKSEKHSKAISIPQGILHLRVKL